jgi:tetratricopeptide (TPR) repeat protein/CHAT domain-containing protein
MLVRRSLLGASVFALAIWAVVWGCQSSPPETNDTTAVSIDSVQQVLAPFETARSPSAADSARLRQFADAVLARADTLASPHPDSARVVLQKALRASRSLADSARLAKSFAEIGRTHAYQSHYDTALEHLRRAASINRAQGHRKPLSDNLSFLGLIWGRRGHYEEALTHHRDARSIAREIGWQEGEAQALSDIGIIHARQGRFEEAGEHWEQSLAVRREIGDREGIAQTLGNLGLLHKNQGHYERALAYYRKTQSLQREMGNQRDLAKTLGNLGVVYKNQGRYEEALAHYQASLSIHRDRGNESGVAATLNNVGSVYENQGRYEKALDHYRKSLAIKQDIGDRNGVANTLNNIGSIRKRHGEYEEALERYQESLSIKREIGDREGVAKTLNNVGIIHRNRGEHGAALKWHREALAIQREMEDRDGIAATLGNIGEVHRDEDQHEEAIRHYRRALQLDREMGRQAEIASALEALGALHLDQGRLRTATDTLSRAVQLAEEVRRNATSPEARRALLSTQIESYRSLATAHVRAGRPDSALRSIERARARLLADRLADSVRTDTARPVPPVSTLRREIDSTEAALLYTNTHSRLPLTALVVTQDSTYARELPESRILGAVERRYAESLEQLRDERGPLLQSLGPASVSQPEESPKLASSIRLYRHRLTQVEGADSMQTDLARQFHELLVSPLDDLLRAKERWTIVPSGALSYLPLEVLRDSTGGHVIERTHVRYTQSLTVLHQLRNREWAPSRRPLLAVGGAAYGAPPSSEETPLLASARGDSALRSGEQASTLLRAAERRLEQGRSPRSAYRRLGYTEWSELQGTEIEARKLKRAVGAGTRIFTGGEATEERIRRMSENGNLSRYRHVHFATHGIVVPEAPQLSALVLAQDDTSERAVEDGYLTMQEIADLRLQADVAVLSACQSGLGRIMAGEGVVGLSQAFLRAGANATLVSQWRVLDWSTQQFMTAVYRRATTQDVSVAEASTHVKRAFIEGVFGERNTDPLRWAPFVYYGRE